MLRKDNLNQHTFKVPKLTSVVEKAIKFFLSTPVVKLPLTEGFNGAGVYALYYLGDFAPYSLLITENNGEYKIPIYVGKAEAKGKRTGSTPDESKSQDLYSRLKKHVKSIEEAKSTLNLEDFRCRFIVMGGAAERDLIVPVEAELIRRYKPVWNRVVHGFGDNPVGRNRMTGAIPKWDILHPGRGWSSNMSGKKREKDDIEAAVLKHFGKLPLF